MEDEPSASSKSQAVFEFTKRKRWADTLIGELVNVAILVFSLTGTIIHCDAAVQDVMGYSEDQIVGKNFSDLLHGGDTVMFSNAFNDSVQTQTELTTYVRVKASDPRDKTTRLVEIKISPYQQPGTTETPCVFAMLNPYPTSSTNDLGDFLALRLENEMLAQRLEALRSGNFSDGTLGSDTEGSDELEDDQSNQENIVDISERALAQVSAVLDAAASSSSAAAAQPATEPTTGYSAHSFAVSGEQTIDGQPIKKKRRLMGASEGRICTACGRNNSPEWRKGPQGAKTLCNACGLRWAKKVKGSTKEGEAE